MPILKSAKIRSYSGPTSIRCHSRGGGNPALEQDGSGELDSRLRGNDVNSSKNPYLHHEQPYEIVPTMKGKGLWLLPRKDAGNTGRADASTRMPTAPQEVWRYGGDAGACLFGRQVGREGYLAQIGHGLELIMPDGAKRWSHRALGVGIVVDVMDFNGDGRIEVLITLGKTGFALLDVATGKTLWSWMTPPGAYFVRFQVIKGTHGARLIVFPAFTLVGLCFDFAETNGAPRLLWKKDYTGKYMLGYGPGLVLADMDQDGKLDIVLASKREQMDRSAYIAVIDSDTGEIKFDLDYPITDGPNVGRPYGLLQAIDLDGDGYPDVVLVSSQVEEYVSVIHNEAGKGLRPAWSQFIEKDFPSDRKEIRPATTSVADVNGDGKPELVLGLFNATGDQRWHTLVLDPLQGMGTPRADLLDRYFWGCHDLDGDGVPEIITSPTQTRFVSSATTLQAVNGKTGQNIATLDDARLVTMSVSLYKPARPLANDLVYYGTLQSPIFVNHGLRVKRTGNQVEELLWRVSDGNTRLEPFLDPDLSARQICWGRGARPCAPTRFSKSPPEIGRELHSDPLSRSEEKEGDEIPQPAASCPLVCVAHGRRELVMALSDGTVIGGTPNLKKSGGFESPWKIKGTMPSLWLGRDGERMVCTVDFETDAVLIQQPLFDRPPVRIQLPMPINRNTSFSDSFPRCSTWLIPFGEKEMRLFVSLRPGEHALACGLYDAEGRMLWSDAERGPHPRAAAVADLDGDGKEEIIMDNHGMQYLYDIEGKHRLVAHCWDDTISGRGDGCAHALPMIGPFGPNGETRIFLCPGYSAMETLDQTGARIAWRPLENHFEFTPRTAAAGQIRGAGRWDIGIVSEGGVFHCIDVNTCQTRWTLDLGCPTSWPVTVVAGDLTGNGCDNFLVSLPNGELVALAEKDGVGNLLWKKQFEAGVWEAILADVDGDDLAEIIVHLDDGAVCILKGL